MDVLNESSTFPRPTFRDGSLNRDDAVLRFEKTSVLPVSASDAWDWHTRPGALARLTPPWQRIEITGGSPRIADGSRVTLRMWKGPFPLSWVAEHRDVIPESRFTDVQVRGPFARWEHHHELLPAGGTGCRLRDRILFAPPGGALGRALASPMLRSDLERAFAWRHRTTAADLAFHRRYCESPRQRVAVTGASGLIGSALCALLSTGGHEVIRLAQRRPGEEAARTGKCHKQESSPLRATWDPHHGLLEPEALEGIDAVIHLAGASPRQTFLGQKTRAQIRASRIEATHHLVESLAKLDAPPRVFASASAIGYYGDRAEARVDESTPAGHGFLADLCRHWEAASARAENLGARVIQLRFGAVLSPASGVLAGILPIFRAALGGRLGSGDQWLSWLSIDDAASAVAHALLTESLEGPVQVSAPAPRRQHELAEVLGRLLRRPTLLGLPAPLVRLALGSIADETVLASIRGVPRKLLDSGFIFRHPGLEEALCHVLGEDTQA